MKRCLIILMITILLAGSTGQPAGASPYDTQISHQAEAAVLADLDLLQGSAAGLLLDQTSTRLEGAVMLVRLLGQESAAASQTYSHPFSDIPPWGSNYIGYLYQQGLCTGIAPRIFDPQASLSAQQYLAFLLRALGYQESQDYTWDGVWQKAVQVQLANQQEIGFWQQHWAFRRDDMALLSYRVLGLKLKGTDTYLLDWIQFKNPSIQIDEVGRQRIINQTYAPPGLPRFNADAPETYYVITRDQISSAIKTSLMTLKPHVRFYLENYQGDPYTDFESVIPAALDQIGSETGMVRLLDTWDYSGDMRVMDINLQYVYSRTQFAELEQKVAQICSDVLKPQMTEYEIEKALHDYIVNHAHYDYQNLVDNTLPESAYTPYGILIKQSGVCQGYAEAMHLLCTQVGLHSQMITGTSLVNNRWVSHAWNLIQIAGDYYHVDTSWDDLSLNSEELLRYTYFNCSDDAMSQDHRWDRSKTIPCTASAYNYYVLHGLLEKDYISFKNRVRTALLQHTNRIDLKVEKFRYSDYGNLSGVIKSEYGVRSYTYNVDEQQGVILIYNIRYR